MEIADKICILNKGWEVLQGLAKSNGELAWKLRIWGLGLWSALVAYGFKEEVKLVFLVALFQVVCIFIMELAARQIQYKFIERSIEIERMLNDLLVGSEIEIPERGISTQIDTPTHKDLLSLFKLKRWLIWFPYIPIFLVTMSAIYVTD